MEVEIFQSCNAEEWDSFCNKAEQATFLHTRKYLNYHGEKFIDRSLLIRDNGNLVGLFIAAESPSNTCTVISHPGLTYGGILHDGGLRGNKMLEAFELIKQFYKGKNYKKIKYKAVPIAYHKIASSDDIYALFRVGANKYRCDLSSAIKLSRQHDLSSRRLRALKKSKKSGVEIEYSLIHLADFWNILNQNLDKKFSTKPTHSFYEISKLIEMFPENISGVFGLIDGAVHAGTILYKTETCYHAQYIASTEIGNATSALDAIFNDSIQLAKYAGVEWFDFGISNEVEGTRLNNGLYQFKSEFGGGGVIHEFYEIHI